MKLERAAALRADLALIGITAIWGFSFPMMQLALEHASAYAFVAVRFAVAALTLLLVFRGRAFRVNRAGLGYGLLLGFWLAAGSLLQTLGLNPHFGTTASKSAFLTALSVILVPILVVIIMRIRPRWTTTAAVFLATAGLYLITSPKGGGFNLGDLLTIGCAVGFALHIIFGEIATAKHDPIPLAFWQMLTTATLGGLAVAITGETQLELTPWTLTGVLVGGVFGSALAFGVQMWALRETSSTRCALILSAEPVFAAVFAGLLLQERFGLTGIIGGAMIVGAIVLSEVGGKKRE